MANEPAVWFRYCYSLVVASGVVCSATHKTLQFREDNTFTIVQFTDLHLANGSFQESADIMEAVLQAESPDFVAYTGDLCEPQSCSPSHVAHAEVFAAAFGPSERRAIPWAVTFGNWDRHPEAYMTGKQGSKFITQHFSHTFNRVARAGVDGDTVFDVAIQPPGSDVSRSTPAFVLYFLDTHANDGCGGRPGTGCIYPSEVAWYNLTSAAYRMSNGGEPIPAMAFFHIPLPEFIDAWNTGDSTFGRLDEPAGKTGLGVSCVIDSSSFFDAVVANGDVKAMTCGHDHDNDFHGVHRGVDLMYGRKTGYGDYGPPDSWGKFPDKDGARVIQLKLNSSSKSVSIDTWIRLKDGTKLEYPQEGHHRPGELDQLRCNSIAEFDAAPIDDKGIVTVI